ncbi:MAG TPA: TatD family hydrolase [Fibrobacteraceae bacterium]|nr:TatD family hydrolase [Fibrobacteraceae bacterium]
MELFDAHNHLQLENPEEHLHNYEQKRIVAALNATCEKEWVELESFAQNYPAQIVVGYGIHPWNAGAVLPDWEKRLGTILETHPAAFVGEIGLDGYRANRACGPGLSRQWEILMPQLRLASRMKRPVSLHSVRAWSELRQALRDVHLSDFLVHRFKGDSAMVGEIVEMGGFLSVHSDTLCHVRSIDALRTIPPDRLLIETDYNGSRSGVGAPQEELVLLLQGLSANLGRSLDDVARLTRENACRFYHLRPIL